MLEKYLPQNQNVAFSKAEKWSLVLITAIGAVIQILNAYHRPFVGDQIGTLINIEKSFSYLLTHFEGWLTMNYFIAFEKLVFLLCGNHPGYLVALPLLAGIAIIPLTGFLALRFSNTKVALIAATLVAANPYLIHYSSIIRSYSLLTMFSLVVIIMFFRWYFSRTLKDGILVSGACYLLLLSHLNGAYVIAYILIICGIDFLTRLTKKQKPEMVTFIVPMIVVFICTVASYYSMYPEIVRWGIIWHDNPPTSISYIPFVFGKYFSGNYYGWLTAFLLIVSFFISYKENKATFILLPCIIIPIIFISIQGVAHFPWAYARFLIFVIPILIIFLAESIDFTATKIFKGKKIAITITITALVIATWLPNTYAVFKTKFDYPWQNAGKMIKDNYRKDDLILCDDLYACLNIYPYTPGSTYNQAVVAAYNNINKNIGKTFFISKNAPVETAHPSYYFGKIQVIIYPRDNDKETVLRLREDLMKSTVTQEIRPELAEIYKGIWAINNKLGIDDHNFRYYNLWVLSFQLTSRQLNIPAPLQRMESQLRINSIP